MSTFAIGSGFNDPYLVTDPAPGVAGWHNVAGKIPRSSYLTAGQSTCVLISKGQSNFTSLGFAPGYNIVNPSVNDNFNVYDGGVYASVFPLLGCTSNNFGTDNNNVPGRVADLLISNGKYQRVIHAPLAISGSTAAEWSTGDCSKRMTICIQRLAAINLTPTVIIDMQGEVDNALGTTAVAYRAMKQTEVQTVRNLGCTAPWLVGICSYNGGTVSDEVRTGQFQSADVGLNILHGADTDFLTAPTYRLDGTHLNATGNTAAANLWYNAIVSGLGL